MRVAEEFKQEVYNEAAFLSGLEHPTLERLLELSIEDRRVRNVTPLYALMFETNKWLLYSNRERYVKRLNFFFHKALESLVYSNSEASELAKDLRFLYYKNGKMIIVKKDHRDASYEMAKLLLSLVRHLNNNKRLNENEELRNKVQERLKQVDFNNLFH